MATEETEIALINLALKHISDKVDKIDERLGEKYVTKEEFEPVKSLIVWGSRLIIGAVILAVLALIFKQ